MFCSLSSKGVSRYWHCAPAMHEESGAGRGLVAVVDAAGSALGDSVLTSAGFSVPEQPRSYSSRGIAVIELNGWFRTIRGTIVVYGFRLRTPDSAHKADTSYGRLLDFNVVPVRQLNKLGYFPRVFIALVHATLLLHSLENTTRSTKTRTHLTNASRG
jgi:hypothetical protein